MQTRNIVQTKSNEPNSKTNRSQNSSMGRISNSCPTAVLFWLPCKLNIRMHHPHVTCQRIITRKGLFLRAKMTPDFHLPVVVNRVFVACQIVRSGEDRVARLARAGIDALAFVRTSLRIAFCDALGVRGRMLPVTLALVPLQFQC